MTWEIFEARMVNESGRSTWTADVKNVDAYDAIDDIPMDERVHRVELKYLDGNYGVAAWYSLKVDGSIVAERSTAINSKAWVELIFSQPNGSVNSASALAIMENHRTIVAVRSL